MIKLTKLDGSKFTLNAELIVTIEETPDTVVSLTTGQKILVKESESEIVEKIIDYKRKLTYINRELA
ncbi:flagellar protein FlbD [Anoxybacter fermentans]|uniref:Flagellar protein FlbD n=1 Tax=Anoxybacter fermentans TaxID=1323375 RepID=A0A3Q9HUX9_9FIRM|nr:flagellar protein FlbD [Anoxybacter fermentans]